MTRIHQTERNNSHNKDPKRQYQGALSRAQGKYFEDFIDASLRYYAQRGEAAIEKTPEPMRPTKDLGNGKFIAFYEKQAQPDYKGTLKGGRTVVFEAKFTAALKIEQSRVTLEQADRFDAYQSMGAICFVVVGFNSSEYYRVPWDVWRGMKEHFGHKHATTEDLSPYRIPVSKNGVLLLLDGIGEK